MLFFTGATERGAPVEIWLPLLANEHGWVARDCRVVKARNGQPALQVACSTLFCSISHAVGVTAVAVHARYPIGVDIEPISRDRDDADLAALFFPQAGAATAAQVDNDHFLTQWTAAEAWLKARGLGVPSLAMAGVEAASRSRPCAVDSWREEYDRQA